MSYIKLCDDNEENVVFPENKIVLLNGTELDCYPKTIQRDDVRLDTTGQYPVVGRRRNPISIADKKSENEIEELYILRRFFLLHAVDFYRQADRILSDSRMFLAPVPIEHASLYFRDLSNLTLGVYIEWWLSNPEACHQVEDELWLTYCLVCKPLSGTIDICVNAAGKTKHFSGSSSKSRSAFRKINTRYAEAKQRYEAYSLYEVWRQLNPDGFSENEFNLFIKTIALERKIDALKYKICELRFEMQERQCEAEDRQREVEKRLYRMYERFHRQQLREVHEKFQQAYQPFLEFRIASANEILRLKKQLADENISHDEYVQTRATLLREYKDYERRMQKLEDELIDSLPHGSTVARWLFHNYLHTKM